MRQVKRFGAMALAGLLAAMLASAAQARQAQAQAQVQSPQQTRQAQQARQQAEAYLHKEEAPGGRAAAEPAPPAAGTPPPSYGPVLNPRQPQPGGPPRKNPAEVHDETDSMTRDAPPPQPPRQPQSQQKPQKQSKQTQRRREAWQAAGPLAPRPLNGNEAAAIGYGAVPIPAPAQPPQPVVPNIAPLNSCVGGACRDTAGGSYNLGPGGTGVSSTGRLCSRSGSTVQCF